MVAPHSGKTTGARSARFPPAMAHASSTTGILDGSSGLLATPKSCLRQAGGSGSSSLPPTLDATYTYRSHNPPRHNRHDSLHRHASPNKQVLPVHTQARPAFARGVTQVRDPSRPVLRRAPTPFHYPDEATGEGQDDADEPLEMEEKEYVEVEMLMKQLAGFMNDLSDLMGVPAMRKYISADKIYALHEVRGDIQADGDVFGVPVQTACAIAPCLAFFSEQQQRLPLVVFSVIEEIYSRGMDVRGLFRIPGDQKRVDRLVRKFSAEPYGEDVAIDQEAIPDLCGLLQTWLDRLPVPILHPALERPFFALVVCGEYAHLSPETRVKVAQLLLRCLPAPNLSLLVYLLSFLSHFQHATKLHVGIIAGLFAKPLAAKPVKGESENAKRARRDALEDAKETVKWLLMNWGLLMDGLMEEPVLEVNPFANHYEEPEVEPAAVPSTSKKVRPPSTPHPVPERVVPQALRPTPNPDTLSVPNNADQSNNRRAPPDPAYVASVERTLDSLSIRLGIICVAVDAMPDPPPTLQEHLKDATELITEAQKENVKALHEASAPKATEGDSGESVTEVEEMRGKLQQVEEENEKLSKKLLAAQKAMAAALSV